VRRRQFLAGAGPLAASALSGCAALPGSGDPGPDPATGTTSESADDPTAASRSDDRRGYHFVSLFNGTDTAHTVSVEVVDAAGESLFSPTRTLAPRSADEHLAFPGTPARVAVDGDVPDSVESAWETDRCGDANESGLDVSVEEPPVRAEGDADRFRVAWTCQSVTLEPNAGR
jgi:hypothetical protein